MSKKDTRTKEFEMEANKVISQVQDAADKLKSMPGADAINIQRRADRFTDGVETVADDLDIQRHGGAAHRKITTSPIDSQGNYTTADGSRQNYIDRLEIHAEHTTERMREDAKGKK